MIDGCGCPVFRNPSAPDPRDAELAALQAKLDNEEMVNLQLANRNLELAAETVRAEDERDALWAEVEKWKKLAAENDAEIQHLNEWLLHERACAVCFEETCERCPICSRLAEFDPSAPTGPRGEEVDRAGHVPRTAKEITEIVLESGVSISTPLDPGEMRRLEIECGICGERKSVRIVTACDECWDRARCVV